jgi:cytochrome c-type biogenesis protein
MIVINQESYGGGMILEYLLSFLEGIITFISPCILPMFPIYVSYFAGTSLSQTGDESEIARKRRVSKTVVNSIGFTLGFTLVFVAMGAFAGTIGSLLKQNTTIINIISGIVVVLFGLYFIGLVKIPFLDKNRQIDFKFKNPGFFSSLLFGLVFSIGWTPCVGVFLGSALMLAASQGSAGKGVLLLLTYSLGLSLPFIISAILIDRLKSTFTFIKKHYKAITLVSGIFLIIIGLLMIFGLMGYFLSLLTIR